MAQVVRRSAWPTASPSRPKTVPGGADGRLELRADWGAVRAGGAAPPGAGLPARPAEPGRVQQPEAGRAGRGADPRRDAAAAQWLGVGRRRGPRCLGRLRGRAAGGSARGSALDETGFGKRATARAGVQGEYTGRSVSRSTARSRCSWPTPDPVGSPSSTATCTCRSPDPGPGAPPDSRCPRRGGLPDQAAAGPATLERPRRRGAVGRVPATPSMAGPAPARRLKERCDPPCRRSRHRTGAGADRSRPRRGRGPIPYCRGRACAAAGHQRRRWQQGKRLYDWTRVPLWRWGWPANVGFWRWPAAPSATSDLACYVSFARPIPRW